MAERLENIESLIVVKSYHKVSKIRLEYDLESNPIGVCLRVIGHQLTLFCLFSIIMAE